MFFVQSYNAELISFRMSGVIDDWDMLFVLQDLSLLLRRFSLGVEVGNFYDFRLINEMQFTIEWS